MSFPWQAARTLRLLANDYVQDYLSAHSVIHDECHMDDMISGAHTIHETREKQRQLIQLLKAGGMQLRKWLSNHSDIISHLPPDHLAVEPEAMFLDSSSFAVLGLH